MQKIYYLKVTMAFVSRQNVRLFKTLCSNNFILCFIKETRADSNSGSEALQPWNLLHWSW